MRFLIGLLALAAVVVGMLFLQGIFASGKVGPGTEVLEPERAGARRTAVVGAETVPLYAEAVGTVRSRAPGSDPPDRPCGYCGHCG